jgi:hypothetical protein
MGSQFLQTKKKPAVKYRTAVDTADDSNGLIYAANYSNGTHDYFMENLTDKAYHLKAQDNGIMLSFALQAAGAVCTVELWAKEHYGSVTYIGDYTITAGEMKTDDGENWADTIAIISAAQWPVDPDLVDIGGADRRSHIKLDAHGCEWILCYVKTLTGAATLSCYARGY